MVGILISIIVLSISLFLISKLPIGVEIDSPVHALIGGAIIGLLYGLFGIIPAGVATVFAVITLGILPLLTSIIVFGLAAWLVEGFRLKWGVWSAILGAIALTIVNSILTRILIMVGIV